MFDCSAFKSDRADVDERVSRARIAAQDAPKVTSAAARGSVGGVPLFDVPTVPVGSREGAAGRGGGGSAAGSARK